MDKIKLTDCYLPVEERSEISLFLIHPSSIKEQLVEKKSDMVVLTKEEYEADKKKTAEDAFEMGFKRKTHETETYSDGFNWLLYEKTTPNKEGYINNLFK
jgi:hypothetical protein